MEGTWLVYKPEPYPWRASHADDVFELQNANDEGRDPIGRNRGKLLHNERWQRITLELHAEKPPNCEHEPQTTDPPARNPEDLRCFFSFTQPAPPEKSGSWVPLVPIPNSVLSGKRVTWQEHIFLSTVCAPFFDAIQGESANAQRDRIPND